MPTSPHWSDCSAGTTWCPGSRQGTFSVGPRGCPQSSWSWTRSLSLGHLLLPPWVAGTRRTGWPTWSALNLGHAASSFPVSTWRIFSTWIPLRSTLPECDSVLKSTFFPGSASLRCHLCCFCYPPARQTSPPMSLWSSMSAAWHSSWVSNTSRRVSSVRTSNLLQSSDAWTFLSY